MTPEQLANIQARIKEHGPCTAEVCGSRVCQTARDRDALLALVREQQARIERVEARLADWASMKPFPDVEESQRWYSLGKRHAADSIRAALTATEGAQ